MKSMGDYHDLCLKKDVLSLAAVFEKSIDTCLKFYKLDPCHCFSSPGLSWDTMLKMTGVRLKKISDIDMYLIIEKGLRGGISNIAKRHSEANNKCMKNYDLTKPSVCIPHLDMNNSCGCGMSDYLPYGRLKWLKNVDNFDVNSISEKSPIGYIFKVDLEYPNELHAFHNDYPLAPEKLAIPCDMLSDLCKKITDKYGIKIGDVTKLIPNLGDKTNYVFHYNNKIYRVLKFNQTEWMKKYLSSQVHIKKKWCRVREK